ncbi:MULTISPECIES: CBS domain-containing protein [Methylomonas]|jgi:CBS domain-containing protein|uniref:Signal transduction protein n=2 Tax=Methylomonas TaxID=416 RepID=A0A177MD83_METMH|nr:MULTISPECIES: CBS domain-containing protein [Methylomonas]MCQ8118352.1 CBS domain-containing protein [Methylomonas sp. WSC-7]OAI03706.1 signal transduction protein [Methylomonas methanica]OAI05475.1 signal transduction protein [Methylomonas methanica]
MLAKIAVVDYMSTKIVTVTPDTEISQAVKILLDHKVTSVPVVDQQGKLVGIFSEKDGMKVFVESAYNQSMAGKVGEFMSKDPQFVNADASLVDVASKFQESPTRSFPVFQNDQFVGMISRVDVLRALLAIR